MHSDSQHSTSKPPRRRRLWWLLGLTVLLLSALLILPRIPLSKERVESTRMVCSTRLREIGQAILLYSNDHQGRYPDSFAELLSYSTDDMFVCPASNDTPATGPTMQAILADFKKGGHLSYIYVGQGLTDKTATANMVVAFEPLSNHGDGMNVLFGDGRVDFLSTLQAGPIIAQWRDGKWPITAPAGL